MKKTLNQPEPPEINFGPLPKPVIFTILTTLNKADLYQTFTVCRSWGRLFTPRFWLTKLHIDFHIDNQLLTDAKIDGNQAKRLYIILTKINYNAIDLKINHPIHIHILMLFKTGIQSQIESEQTNNNEALITEIVKNYKVLDHFKNSIAFYFAIAGDTNVYNQCSTAINDNEFLLRNNSSGANPLHFAFYQQNKAMITRFHIPNSQDQDFFSYESNGFDCFHYSIWGGTYCHASNSALIRFRAFSDSEATTAAAEKSQKPSIINLIKCRNTLLKLLDDKHPIQSSKDEIKDILVTAAQYDNTFFREVFTKSLAETTESEPNGITFLREELHSNTALQEAISDFLKIQPSYTSIFADFSSSADATTDHHSNNTEIRF